MSRIKKTSETRPLASHTVNAHSESEINAYSCDYINDALTYSTDEINTHKKWIDEKDIYRKVITGTINTSGNFQTIDTISNLGVLIDAGGRIIDTTNNIQFLIGKSTFYNNTGASRIITVGNNIRLDYPDSYHSMPFTAIIEYTKTTQSTRSVNTYGGDIEEKKDIVIDDGGEKPIDDGNKK